MIKFFDILRLYGIDPKYVKLVRHGNKEIPVRETFVDEREKFESYQSFQKPRKFGGARYIATFCPARGTTALFLGVWDILGFKENHQLTRRHHREIDRFGFPARWHERAAWYDLSYRDDTADLSERLVIDWGKSTVSWVQSKDKPVIEIKALHSIGEFVSYDDIQLDYVDLQRLCRQSDANPTWVNALSAVNGVYLIRDTASGLLYVGSAYGDKGIFARWCHYARSGHGGNRWLKPLDPRNFEFSILEIAPSTMSADGVIERENRWKARLGTRESGLNEN